MQRRAHFILRLGAVFLLLTAVACKEVPIQHNLSEEDANEILVLFHRHHIEAKKESAEKNQEVTWNIVVKPDEEAQARELLVENQLPRKLSLGLGGVCKDEGLIPTPKREKCRELLAYKGELVNSLEKISGVVDADVVLTIPDQEEFLSDGQTQLKPTASVVVKAKIGSDGAFPLQEEQVQRFVSNAIPGMDPRNVAVILTPVSPWETTTMATAGMPKTPAVTLQQEGNADEAGDEDVEISTESDAAAYTSIFGINIHVDSIEKFKQVGLIAMMIFLVMSALLVGVLYLQIRGKRRFSGGGGLSANGALGRGGIADDDHLLEAPEAE